MVSVSVLQLEIETGTLLPSLQKAKKWSACLDSLLLPSTRLYINHLPSMKPTRVCWSLLSAWFRAIDMCYEATGFSFPLKVLWSCVHPRIRYTHGQTFKLHMDTGMVNAWGHSSLSPGAPWVRRYKEKLGGLWAMHLRLDRWRNNWHMRHQTLIVLDL